MPLSAHKLRTEKVRLSKDNDMEVRAITFPDLALIMQDRMPELIAILAKYQEGRKEVERGGTFTPATLSDIAIMAARDFPSLTTEIVSCCVHGEVMTPEMRNLVNSLSVVVQLDAISKIVKLTVEEAGGLGNLLSDLRSTLATAMAGEEGLTT